MSQIQAFVSLDIFQLQAYSQNDIISKIPPNILAEIKAKDEHPFFQLYSICHEGTSTPKIEGKGHKPITWFKKAIQSIKSVIKKGIKFFDGHNSTNDNQDKKILGEVIHAFEEEIDNKLHYCTIGYFPPETREIAKTKDICSQEAEWNLFEVAGQYIADVCQEITGIALANSKEGYTPAFEGAKRLGLLQAFSDTMTITPVGETVKETKIMTFSELKDKVRELNVHPHQLYNLDEIKDDKEFGKVYDEIKTLTDEKTELEKKIDNFEKENTKLTRSIQLDNAKDKLKEIYKESQTTENMQKFINDIYDEQKDKLEDLSDDGLKAFVETQTKIYQKATNTIDTKNNVSIPSGDDQTDVDGHDSTKKASNTLLDDDYNPEDYI